MVLQRHPVHQLVLSMLTVPHGVTAFAQLLLFLGVDFQCLVSLNSIHVCPQIGPALSSARCAGDAVGHAWPTSTICQQTRPSWQHQTTTVSVKPNSARSSSISKLEYAGHYVQLVCLCWLCGVCAGLTDSSLLLPALEWQHSICCTRRSSGSCKSQCMSACSH